MIHTQLTVSVILYPYPYPFVHLPNSLKSVREIKLDTDFSILSNLTALYNVHAIVHFETIE